MPTLYVDQQTQVSPTKATPDVRIPAGAFSADYRAMTGLGATIQRAGGQFADVAIKTELLEKASQIRKGQAAYDEFYTKSAVDRLKDTDFANHRKTFDESHDNWTSTYLSGVESVGAKDRLGLYFDSQKARQGLRIEADAFISLGREIAANQPQARQISIEAELNEPEIENQQAERADYAKSLDELIAAGHMTPAGKQQELRLRAMQLVQTAADRDPEMVLNAIDEKKLNVLLGDVDVKLLLPDDIDALRIDAKQELTAANRKIQLQQSAQEEATEAVKTDISQSLYSPKTSADLGKVYDQIYDRIISSPLLDDDDHTILINRLDARAKRLTEKEKEGGAAGEFGDILHRLNMDPDEVSWDEIEKYKGDTSNYRILVSEKEQTSSLLKNSSVNFWFKKLNQDFAKEPVLVDKYSREFREYFMEYQQLHNKIPSPAEIEGFYDKNFVEPGLVAWLGRAAGAVWTGYTYIHPFGIGAHVSKWATKEREKRLNSFADDLESGTERRGGYSKGERIDVGGRKYKVVGFDAVTNEPLVEPID